MKKFFAFSGLALAVLVLFACSNLTLPSAVEIKGSPSLKFAANVNLTKYFRDIIDDVFAEDSMGGGIEIKMLECTHEDYQYMTFLLKIELFKEQFQLDIVDDIGDLIDVGSGTLYIPGVGEVNIGVIMDELGEDHKIEIEDDIDVFPNGWEEETISFAGLGDHLEGFEFHGIKAMLYLDGSEIINNLTIHIKSGETNILNAKNNEPSPSGINFEGDIYTASGLPDGGIDFPILDLLNNKADGDVDIQYRVYLTAGSEFEIEWLLENEDHDIIAELVIELPLRFRAGDDAEFNLSDMLGGMGDFIKELTDLDIIESMNIQIGMYPDNPFKDEERVVELVIKSPGMPPIVNPMEKDSLNFKVDEEHLDFISNNPFNPEFFITFERGAILGIPRTLILTTVSLNAKGSYILDLDEVF